jgi:predicted DNA-binding transcriptional regulator AlpA
LRHMDPTPVLISESDLCEILGWSPRQAYLMRQRGLAPPHIRVGLSSRGAIRYDMADVKKWLRDRRVRGKP